MDNLFRYDNKFFEALGKISNIVILNLLCILSCLPIITIGASATATYFIAMQIVKDEESYIIKEFIKRFKENFIISTKIWIIMMIIGVVLAALATVLYLKPALGSGPRDGLMLAINKRSSKSVGTVRTIIELSVLFIGWILGGSVGIGTIISGVGLGYAIEIGFKISHMDSKTLVHKNIYDSIKLFRNKDAQIATCVETDKEK